jgi:hypothetical protein
MIDDKNFTIYIIGLYRSPSGDIDNFLKNLEYLLNNSMMKNHKFVIIGDLNINVLEEGSPNTKRLKDLLNTFYLKCFINSPKRVTENTESAIDNVISNIANLSVSVIVTAIGDHDAQLVSINNNTS